MEPQLTRDSDGLDCTGSAGLDCGVKILFRDDRWVFCCYLENSSPDFWRSLIQQSPQCPSPWFQRHIFDQVEGKELLHGVTASQGTINDSYSDRILRADFEIFRRKLLFLESRLQLLHIELSQACQHNDPDARKPCRHVAQLAYFHKSHEHKHPDA